MTKEQNAAKMREWRAKNPERAQAAYKKWCAANPEKARENSRKSMAKRRLQMYGVTQEWYDATYVAQGGVCCICKKPETDTTVNGCTFTLSVDHNHETGEVRGLLCGRCNKGLGLFDDNADRVRAAAAYRDSYR